MDTTLQRFIEDVRAKRVRVGDVAKATGVHPKVLNNIFYGATKDPRASNLTALQAYYAKQDAA